MKYKINRVEFSNFKIVRNSLEVSFDGSDLVVLDGPNGFGKTSVFDAIEFLLTGVVKRLEIYDKEVKNTKRKNKFPLHNNLESDLVVKMELVCGNEKKYITRYIPQNLLDKRTNSIDWSISKIKALESWESSYETAPSLTQKELENLINVESLSKIFSVFFYVQQEENAFYLKSDEKNRKHHLDILFNVEDESSELEKISNVRNRLRNRRRNLRNEITSLGSVKDTSLKKPEEVIFLKLFDEVDIPWDKEDFQTEKYELKDILSELEVILGLVKRKEDFFKQRASTKIRVLSDNKNILISYLLSSIEEVERDKILRDHNEVLKIERIIALLEKKESLEFEEIASLYSDTIDSDENKIKAFLKNFKDYNQRLKTHSESRKQLVNIQNMRKRLFETHKEHSKEGSCPLCGHDYEEFQALLNAFEAQSLKFEITADKDLQKLKGDIDVFIKHLEEELRKNIEKYQKVPGWIAKLLSNLEQYSDSIQEMKKYFSSKSINTDKYMYLKSELLNENLLASKYKSFKDKIDEELRKDNTINEDTYSDFVRCFLSYFEEKEASVSKFKLDSLAQKKKYLSFIFTHNKVKKNEEAKARLKLLDDLMSKLDQLDQQLKDAEDIYKINISNHISSVINDISIPFYIYSGRILQDYFGGKGLFVKLGKLSSEGVKFYSNIDIENDPLYNLSSGQISALVISFCLALNQVYSDHDFGSILIDDPIQTMDDVNTLSFIDLIRHGFSNRQFIISTHEDSFSSLIRHRFVQNGLSVSRISMKDKV